MLSYALDRHRHKQRAAAAAASEPAAATAAATAAAAAAAAERHSLAVYVAYLFYPPLYLAGPIVTYDDFEAQWASPSASSLLLACLTHPDPLTAHALCVLCVLCVCSVCVLCVCSVCALCV